ncbi:MAG: TonB-dependent receptor [Oceanospirillaceae bacterium]|nr:TonB-dependent receptor [Oceanospirillaceae bacterium]
MKKNFLIVVFLIPILISAQSVSINVREPKIIDVIELLRNNGKYQFAFKESVNENTTLQLDIKQEFNSISEFLEYLTKNTLFSFVLDGQTIIIKSKKIKISGMVKDKDGNTIPGVTVYSKELNIGTITDFSGEFVLEGVITDSTIDISYLGYKTKSLKIINEDFLEITLESATEELDEIVIVGYGKQKRSNLTGSISTVKMEDISNRPIVRIDQALQGLSSGVNVSKAGGAPGSSPTIHIRGIGSISDTSPLWIVDGVKMNPSNFFNVEDIESVEILKDAASSSIYGAEAAHGVILITTKRGAKSNSSISFSNSYVNNRPIQLPVLLNSEQFVKYKKISRLNSGSNPEPSWDNYIYDTDWLKEFYGGSGISHYHDFSISNSTDKLNYFLSLGHDNETGILIDNNFQKTNLRINSDYKITPKITIGESLSLTSISENPIDNFNENYNGAIPYRSIPIMPVFDETNKYGGWGRAPLYFQGSNPVASQLQTHHEKNTTRIDLNSYVSIDFSDHFNITSRIGLNYASFLGRKFNEGFDYGAYANPINSLEYATSQDKSLNFNAVASYNNHIKDHNYKFLAGYEAFKFETAHFNVIGTNFPVEQSWSLNLATGTFNTTDRRNVFNSRLLSQFGRFNYNYKEKYLLEVNARRDASAPIFGPENIWGVFPSYSIGWNVIKEKFVSNIDYLSNLKLRFSNGKLGSDNISSFIYNQTYNSQFASYTFDENGQNKVSGFYIGKFPNAEVKWEEVHMKNFGVDLGLFRNILSINLDYYIKKTEDLLYAVPVPSSIGLSTHNFNTLNPEINIGEMLNKGFDMDMKFNKSYSNFDVNLQGNISFLSNKLVSLNNDEYIIGGSGGGQIGGMTRTQPGMPISSFYGFVVQQMLNSDQDIFAINSYAPDGIYQEAGTAPGDFMYMDISGPEGIPDGEITWEYDRAFIGNPWPKISYGFNTNINFKQRIDLNLMFQGIYDVDVFNAEKAYSRNFFGDSNTTVKIMEAWTPEHPTGHPRNIANDPNGNFSRPSTYFIEDGSYLKLKNIQIGYNFSKNSIDSIGLKNLRIFLNAYNIFTITNYSGLDPEIAGSNLSRGIDYGQYPQTFSFGGGINVNL